MAWAELLLRDCHRGRSKRGVMMERLGGTVGAMERESERTGTERGGVEGAVHGSDYPSSMQTEREAVSERWPVMPTAG